LEQSSVEDVVSHLYVTEAYYLNPKQVKRAQLKKLVQMIQNSLQSKKPTNRRKNFFERKRLINYDAENYNQSNEKRHSTTPEELSVEETKLKQGNRKRFDELRQQNKSPAKPDLQIMDMIVNPLNRSSPPREQALPPLKNAR